MSCLKTQIKQFKKLRDDVLAAEDALREFIAEIISTPKMKISKVDMAVCKDSDSLIRLGEDTLKEKLFREAEL